MRARVQSEVNKSCQRFVWLELESEGNGSLVHAYPRSPSSAAHFSSLFSAVELWQFWFRIRANHISWRDSGQKKKGREKKSQTSDWLIEPEPRRLVLHSCSSRSPYPHWNWQFRFHSTLTKCISWNEQRQGAGSPSRRWSRARVAWVAWGCLRGGCGCHRRPLERTSERG